MTGIATGFVNAAALVGSLNGDVVHDNPQNLLLEANDNTASVVLVSQTCSMKSFEYSWQALVRNTVFKDIRGGGSRNNIKVDPIGGSFTFIPSADTLDGSIVVDGLKEPFVPTSYDSLGIGKNGHLDGKISNKKWGASEGYKIKVNNNEATVTVFLTDVQERSDRGKELSVVFGKNSQYVALTYLKGGLSSATFTLPDKVSEFEIGTKDDLSFGLARIDIEGERKQCKSRGKSKSKSKSKKAGTFRDAREYLDSPSEVIQTAEGRLFTTAPAKLSLG
ncbi:MAG: hypothetical protein ACRBCT_05050 [Alphaproteobacteria bacterium]